MKATRDDTLRLYDQVFEQCICDILGIDVTNIAKRIDGYRAKDFHPRGDHFGSVRLPEFQISWTDPDKTLHPLHIVGRYLSCQVHSSAITQAMHVADGSDLSCRKLATQWHNRFSEKHGTIYLDPFFDETTSTALIDLSPRLRLVQGAIAGEMVLSTASTMGISLQRAARMLSWSTVLQKKGPQWLSECWDHAVQPEYWLLAHELEPSQVETALAWFRKGGSWAQAMVAGGILGLLVSDRAAFRKQFTALVNAKHYMGIEAAYGPNSTMADLFKTASHFDEYAQLLNQAQALERDDIWGRAQMIAVPTSLTDSTRDQLFNIHDIYAGTLLLLAEDTEGKSLGVLRHIVNIYAGRLQENSGVIPLDASESFTLPVHGGVRFDHRTGLACEEVHADNSLCSEYLSEIVRAVGGQHSLFDGEYAKDGLALQAVVLELLSSRLRSSDDGNVLRQLQHYWLRSPQAWSNADLLPGYVGLPVVTSFIPAYVALGLHGEEVYRWTCEGLIDPAQIWLAGAISKGSAWLRDGAVAHLASNWDAEQIKVLRHGLKHDEKLIDAVVQRGLNGYPVKDTIQEMLLSEFHKEGVAISKDDKPTEETLRSEKVVTLHTSAYENEANIRRRFKEIGVEGTGVLPPSAEVSENTSGLLFG